MKPVSSLLLALLLGIAFTFTSWVDTVESSTPAYRTFVDPGGNLTLQDILSNRYANRFIPAPEGPLRLPGNNGTLIERILIDNGYLWEDPEQVDENVFNTDAYKLGQYEGRIRRQLSNLKLGVHSYDKKAGKDKSAIRNVQESDGILLPRFRLPTEAEWEFAALALVGNTLKENVSERKLYPWNGDGVRNPSKRNKGEIVANFKRGRGDNMGTAGRLNDNADKTAPARLRSPESR